MIIEWILNLAAGFIETVTAPPPGVDEWEIPAWVEDFDSFFNTVFAGMDGLSAWIDWPITLAVVSLSVTTWLLFVGLKTVRAIASYLPFFGGSG